MKKQKTGYQFLMEKYKKRGEKPSRFVVKLIKTADNFIRAQERAGLALSDVMEKRY